MMRTGAIEELAKLLGEDRRLAAKLGETRAILADIKKRISQSLVRQYVTFTDKEIPTPEELMKQEQSYERLLQVLLEMKADIANRIKPVENQVIQANVEHLREVFEQEKNRLGERVQILDGQILECQRCIEAHAKIRENLYAVNEKLVRLGAEALAVPEPLDSANLSEILRQRIESLKSQGKL
jgi:hypothetical protein